MYNVAKKFYGKYGGEWTDWVSEGHEIFMKAYQRYDYTKGPFDRWFNFFLNRLFTERVRRLAMKQARLARVYVEDIDGLQKKSRSFNCMAFLRDLSDDARTVAMLVLDTPNDVKLCMLEYHRNIPKRDKFLNSINEFLTDLGWSSDRIHDSYDEVSEALC